MSTSETATLLTNLRGVFVLTNTEIALGTTCRAQARTDAAGREIEQNATHGRERALAIATAIRDLGGPAALRRAASRRRRRGQGGEPAGLAGSPRGGPRSGMVRSALPKVGELLSRGDGANQTADLLDTIRTVTGVLNAEELPVTRFDDLSVPQAVSAMKDLDDSADLRAILGYEEANKARQGVIAAAHARIAAVAQEAISIP